MLNALQLQALLPHGSAVMSFGRTAIPDVPYVAVIFYPVHLGRRIKVMLNDAYIHPLLTGSVCAVVAWDQYLYGPLELEFPNTRNSVDPNL